MAILNQPGTSQSDQVSQEQQPAQSRPGESYEQQATPQEQQLYEYFSQQALAFIHADETSDYVVNKVKSSTNLQATLGEVAAVIIRRLEVQNPEEVELLNSVLEPVIEDIVEELVDMSISAGYINENEVDDNYYSQLIELGVQNYLQLEEQSGGKDAPTRQQELRDLLSTPESQQGVNAMSNEARANMSQWLGGENG